MPPLTRTRSAGAIGEHVVPRAGGRPHLVVGEEVGVDEDVELGGVAERRHAADRIAGRLPHRVGVDPRAALAAGGRGQLGLDSWLAPLT